MRVNKTTKVDPKQPASPGRPAAADGESRAMRRFTAASVGVHALILLGFFVVPVVRPQKPIFAEPIYEVAMFKADVPNYQPPKPVHVDPEPARPTVDKPQDAPQPKVTVPVPPEPIQPKPGNKPKPQPQVEEKPKPPVTKPKEEPKEKDRKPPARVEDVQKTEPPAEKVPEMKSAPPDEMVSFGMVDQKDFKQNTYLMSIRVLLAREWAKAKPGTQGLKTSVHFVILRDGSIELPEITASSGSSLHDREALAALKRVGKFPPLPEGYSGDKLSPTAVFTTGDR